MGYCKSDLVTFNKFTKTQNNVLDKEAGVKDNFAAEVQIEESLHNRKKYKEKKPN
jgi:hypothetical protein